MIAIVHVIFTISARASSELRVNRQRRRAVLYTFHSQYTQACSVFPFNRKLITSRDPTLED